MKFLEFFSNPIASSVGQVGSWLLNRRGARSDYERMIEENSPANWRRKMELAGLNPILGYSGGVSNNTANLTTPTLNPQYNALNHVQVLGAIQEMRLKENEEKRTEQDFDVAFSLRQIEKSIAELNKRKTEADVEDWLHNDNRHSRNRAQRFDDTRKGYEQDISRSKAAIAQIEADIKKEASGELKKYAKLLPYKEFQIVNERLNAIILSNEYQHFINDNQYKLVDPDAPLFDRLIQSTIQELLRGTKVDFDQFGKFLPNVNPLNLSGMYREKYPVNER